MSEFDPIQSVIQGDCLKVLKELPDNFADLILTDPPYFRVKTEWWDRQWDNPKEFLAWLDRVAEQWQRVLKPNGSLYCFASPKMAARVEVLLGERFNVLNHLVWDKDGRSRAAMTCKEESRSFFPETERIIFCEHYGADNIAKGEAGYGAKCDEAAREVWGDYIKQVRRKYGLSAKQLTEVVGAYGTVNHGGACSNWEKGKNCPTPEHYTKLQQAFPGYFTRPYEDLRQQYEELRQQYEELRQQYEELRRPFNVTADVPYTDVWTFPTVSHYPGKHPCEKPAALLEHIIKASTRPGTVVLDCFAGSGSTLVSAQTLNRQCLGIEIDPHWVAIARQRLGDFSAIAPSQESQQLWLQGQAKGSRAIQPNPNGNVQLDLFSGISSPSQTATA